MQLLNDFRMLDEHFRNEGTGLQVAAAFELEDIPFGADHGSLGEARHEARFLDACGASRLAGFCCRFLQSS